MEKKEQDKQKLINDFIQSNEEAKIKLIFEIKKYNEQNLHNTDKMINDVSVQNEALDFFSKCKQNKLTIFTHVRISTENIIGKKSLKKFWLKKLPNKGTIVKARLVLEKISLETLVPLYFHLLNQELMMK